MTDRLDDSGKAHLVARHQFWRTTTNSLVYCFFTVFPAETIANLQSCATGLDWSVDRLIEAGERACNLKRVYNCRLGLTPKTEKLPKLLLEGLAEGGQNGHVPDLANMLKEYYTACGWNPDTGHPNPEKLQALGLDFVLKV